MDGIYGSNSRVKLIILIVFVGIFILLSYFNLFNSLENKLYDITLLVRHLFFPQQVENIVLVNIDENTINQLGGWPISRKYYAKALTKLEEAGVKVIGLDLIFSDERTGDNQLKKVLKRNDNIILPIVAKLGVWRGIQGSKVNVKDINRPIPDFANNATLGHINYIPDRDGIIRSIWPKLYFKDQKIPSFSLQVAKKYNQVNISEDKRKVLLNYPGPAGSIPGISFLDLLNGEYNKDFFEDKIVLIGTDNAGLGDRYMTSFSRYGFLSGVEINGQAVYNFINNSYIISADTTYNIILILLFGLLHIIIFYKFKPIKSALILIMTTGIYTFINIFVLYNFNFNFTLFSPLLEVLILYLISIGFWYFNTEKEKKFINQLFSRYVSSEVLQELTNNPELARPGGKKMEVSVIFVDIRDFTSFARDNNPERVVEKLNKTFKIIGDVIISHNGTLDKYLGDGFIAFFGAPLPYNNHSQKCFKAACEIQRLSSQGRLPFKLGVGLDTGSVIVGNIGSEKMMDYTIIGESVNRAARFVDMANRDEIILSEEFWSRIGLEEKEDIKNEIRAKRETVHIDQSVQSIIRLLRRNTN